MTFVQSFRSIPARKAGWEGVVTSLAVAASASLAATAPDAGQRVEQAFDTALPFREPVERFWSSVDARYLGTPRPGAIFGTNGWLYTTEELPPPERTQRAMERRLAAIRTRITALEARGVGVVVALLPTKMASTPGSVSEAAVGKFAALYTHARTRLGVTSPDLTRVLKTGPRRQTFFQFDTHWTPLGAGAVATAIATAIPSSHGAGSSTCQAPVRPEQRASLRGDLLAFAPWLSATSDPRVEALSPIPSACFPEEGLLDAPAMPAVVLVGTSYSADPRWGFAAFLSREMGQPVLNAAVPGRGPFVAVDALLADPAFRADPPGLVVWEIPVRSLWQPCTGATHDVC